MPADAYLTAHSSALHKIGARVPDAREFVHSYQPALGMEENITRAYQNRWYGNSSVGVCARMTRHFAVRFDRFPGYLNLMKLFLASSSSSFPLLNHFHMVLADPYYRWAASEYLAKRLAEGRLDIPKASFEDASALQLPATVVRGGVVRYARNVLTALRDNGFLAGRGTKTIVSPTLDTRTLGWMLFTLAEFGQGSKEFDQSAVFASLLKSRDQLIPLFNEGERLGWWEFTGDRKKLLVQLKYDSLSTWLGVIA